MYKGINIQSMLLKLLLMGIAIGGGLLLLSAVKTKDAKPCHDIEIDYAKGKEGGFVNNKSVNIIIANLMQRKPQGTPLHLFNLKAIEKALEENPWVADAQLYFDNNQVLHVYIDEPHPIARCIDKNGKQFYLDVDLLEMPLSPDYHLNVPVFTGLPVKRGTEKSKELLGKITGIGKWIVQDSFWLAQVAQIDVSYEDKIVMIPTLGHHVVELGDGSDPDGMFIRLGIFYKMLAAAGSIDIYERINASFSNQIVASKSILEVSKEDRTAAMNTFNRIVNENKKIVNESSVTSSLGVGRIVEDIPVSGESERTKKAYDKNKQSTDKENNPSDKIDNKLVLPEGKTNQEKGAEKEEKSKTETIEKKELLKPKAIMPKTQNN